MTWRQGCAPIINKVICDNKDKSLKELRKLLKEAYPYGVRQYHPYKVWCDEIKKQLTKAGKIKRKELKSNQKELFQ